MTKSGQREMNLQSHPGRPIHPNGTGNGNIGAMVRFFGMGFCLSLADYIVNGGDKQAFLEYFKMPF